MEQQPKKGKTAKWLLEEALQIAVKRREAKSKGEKERYKHVSFSFSPFSALVLSGQVLISGIELFSPILLWLGSTHENNGSVFLLFFSSIVKGPRVCPQELPPWNWCHGLSFPVLLLPDHIRICRLVGWCRGVLSCEQEKGKVVEIPVSCTWESFLGPVGRAELWARKPGPWGWWLSSDPELVA